MMVGFATVSLAMLLVPLYDNASKNCIRCAVRTERPEIARESGRTRQRRCLE